MRIWDIHPGYLNGKSLLGEHAEIHALTKVILGGGRGYHKHPETLRWKECLGGLAALHEQVSAEMSLRGFKHKSPLELKGPFHYPHVYVTPPGKQFELLAKKYQEKPQGRIPIPKNPQNLWSQHKYGVMAVSQIIARKIGRQVANHEIDFDHLAEELVKLIRQRPDSPNMTNALSHMYGHYPRDLKNHPFEQRSPQALLSRIWSLHRLSPDPFINSSTALSGWPGLIKQENPAD